MTPGVDALLPPEMAAKAEEAGARKAAMDAPRTLLLAVLAGAFIALGANFATVALAGTAGAVPWGWARVVAGVVFSTGLGLVVVGGAELFTGNTLLVMAWASGRVTTRLLLRNWALVYAGNFAGGAGTAVLACAAGQYRFGGGEVGRVALDLALQKVQLGFGQAVALGVLCNALVCLAVWLTLSARSTTDRLAAVVLPVAAFVAGGFEHSVANMYVLPLAMLVRADAPAAFWTAIGRSPEDYAAVEVGGAVTNLVAVTIGNVIGGALLVGAVYWGVYLRGGARRA